MRRDEQTERRSDIESERERERAALLSSFPRVFSSFLCSECVPAARLRALMEPERSGEKCAEKRERGEVEARN